MVSVVSVDWATVAAGAERTTSAAMAPERRILSVVMVYTEAADVELISRCAGFLLGFEIRRVNCDSVFSVSMS